MLHSERARVRKAYPELPCIRSFSSQTQLRRTHASYSPSSCRPRALRHVLQTLLSLSMQLDGAHSSNESATAIVLQPYHRRFSKRESEASYCYVKDGIRRVCAVYTRALKTFKCVRAKLSGRVPLRRDHVEVPLHLDHLDRKLFRNIPDRFHTKFHVCPTCLLYCLKGVYTLYVSTFFSFFYSSIS